MSNEQVYFISLLRDFLNNQKSEIKQVDWKIISEYAKKHQVEAIIYYQTQNKLFQKNYYAQIYRYAIQNEEIKRIKNILNDKFLFIVKGPTVAELYPIKELRSMGDVDIITSDKYASAELMESIGYRRISYDLNEVSMIKNEILFELHDKLLYSELANEEKQMKFINNFDPYVNNGMLDWNFHFIYLLLHLKKHIVNSGVGFRQFMDIAVMLNSGLLDYKYIEDKSKEIGLYKFLQTVLCLVYRWFNFDCPIRYEDRHESFFEMATNKIFEDGVFGFDSEKNKNNVAVTEYNKRGRVNRLIDLLKYIFIPYDEIIKEPKYSYVKGKKILMPWFWLSRLIRNIKSSGNVIRRYYTSKKVILQRNKMLDDWGCLEAKDK